MIWKLAGLTIATLSVSLTVFCQSFDFARYKGYAVDAEGFTKYLSDNVQYPDSLKERCIYGLVVLKFPITTDGTVGKISVLHTPHPDLAAELKRALLKTSGKWSATKVKGKRAEMYYTLPFFFDVAQGSCPDFAAYYNSGKKLVDDEDYEGALEKFLSAHAIDPKDTKTYFMLAECYRQLDRADDLCLLIDKAARLKCHPRVEVGPVALALKETYKVHCEQ